jgi:TRAP-type mannitol/chloroaromatic compound transport system permease small subunit
MGSVSLVTRLADSIDHFADRTGHTAAWLALLLVLVTFSVVVLRYLFEFGSIALQEAVLYLHASLFLLGAAYTLKMDAHVRVDIIYRHLSERARALIDLLGALLLLLPVCGFLLWISWDYVASAWSLHEGSPETGGLPYVYLLKTLIPVAAGMLILQGFGQALRCLATLARAADGES